VGQHVDRDDDDGPDGAVGVESDEGVGELHRVGVLAVVEVQHRVGAGTAGVVAGWEVDRDFDLLGGEGGGVEVQCFDGGGLRGCRLRGRRGDSEAGGKQDGGNRVGDELHGAWTTRFDVGAT